MHPVEIFYRSTVYFTVDPEEFRGETTDEIHRSLIKIVRDLVPPDAVFNPAELSMDVVYIHGLANEPR
jgi:hypothetical protein